MGFLSPLFLVGVLAAAVPIALHLFRRQAGPVVPFSAVRFVPRLPLHRTRRRQLQDVLLLALRVAAIVLLAVAFARPYLSAAPTGRQSPLAVIAIDRSFSMSAPGRMAQARDLASRAIDQLGSGELVDAERTGGRQPVQLGDVVGSLGCLRRHRHVVIDPEQLEVLQPPLDVPGVIREPRDRVRRSL